MQVNQAVGSMPVVPVVPAAAALVEPGKGDSTRHPESLLHRATGAPWPPLSCLCLVAVHSVTCWILAGTQPPSMTPSGEVAFALLARFTREGGKHRKQQGRGLDSVSGIKNYMGARGACSPVYTLPKLEA